MLSAVSLVLATLLLQSADSPAPDADALADAVMEASEVTVE